MAEIHILDSETIDKIAAGEVVERPASVVKELVENAIDAGATAVTVEIKDGGIEFIRVTDNGSGMERGQLRRAFLRHATSKIEDAGDLERISSLGFRGEALSSIAAVAKVEVITKTSGDIIGSRILLEGSRETAFDEVGAPEGTTFLIRNLFFNTPARRKFLKQPATEGGYIADLMEHLALSRPDISFKFTMGGQMKFHTSCNGDLREVVYRIYGRDVARELVPIQAKQEGIRVEGYLGKPVQVRSNRNFEIYFINGRFIRSNVVSKAVEEGYKEYLMQHKFPLCVLHITMDAHRVDVNVHPAKMDVRFSNAMEFCDFLMRSVKRTLRDREMIPEASLSTSQELKAEKAQKQREKGESAAPEPFEDNRSSSYRLMEEARYHAEQTKEQTFFHNPVWSRIKGENVHTQEKALRQESEKISRQTVPGGKEEPGAYFQEQAAGQPESTEDFFTETSELPEPAEELAGASKGRAPAEDFLPEASEQPALMEDFLPEASEQRAPAEDFLPEASREPEPAEPFWGQNPKLSDSAMFGKVSAGEAAAGQMTSPAGVQLNLFEERILTADNRSRFRIIGQVFDTYWLIEYEEKLLMIDQHAAHEKVNYERLMGQYRQKNVLSQGLLPPVIVTLSGQEEAVLKENLDTFCALGFEVEAFGGSEYALRSVPTDLYGCQEQEMFLEVLDGLIDGSGFGGIRVIEEKIASMSCKAAVKGNSKMNVREAEALIDELLALENPYNCPHGRPVIVSMTRAEMDKKFKRIVS